MKKLILLIVLFIISVIYSITWFVIAKGLEEGLAEQIIKSPDPISGQVSEDNTGVTITGFPLDFNVFFAAGNYTVQYPEEDIIVNFAIDTPVAYYVKVFEKNVRIILPKNIAVKYSIKGEEEKVQLSYKGENPSEISLYFNSRLISNLKDLLSGDMKSNTSFMESTFFRDLRKIKYLDSGILIFKGDDNKILYSHDKFLTELKKNEIEENYGSYSVLLEYTNSLLRNEYYREVVRRLPKGITKNELDVLKWVLDEAKRSGSSSGRIDFKYTGYLEPAISNKPYFDIVINQIVYTDHVYSINTSGQLTYSEEDIFPYGWIKIDIENYKKLIDYYSRYYNSIIFPGSYIDGQRTLKKLDIAEVEMYKKLVPRIGKVSSDEEGILVSISRPKGAKDVFVGNTTLSRLKVLLRKEYKRYRKQLEKSREAN